MEKLLPTTGRYKQLISGFRDDDFIDRLNNRWTVIALIMCIFVITGNISFGKSINCWTPQEFVVPHIEYANSICWLKGSYYLPTEERTIPEPNQPRNYFVSYYQWTPFILLGMILLFLFPQFLWHILPRQSGINIKRLINTITTNADTEKGLDIAKRTLKEYLDAQDHLREIICCSYLCQKCYFGHTFAYLSVKLLYFINTVTQFFLLNSFLSFHFTSYRAEALKKMFKGEDWFESPRFPRVTMCDFMIRRLGSNQHWYTVQCNLPINIYNEKIFLGIWIWLIILTIFNIFSIISWIISLVRPCRLASIKKYLKISPSISMERERLLDPSITTLKKKRNNTDEDVHNFVDYLELDGYLIIQLISRNTNEIVAGKIIKFLFEHYERHEVYLPSNV